MTHPDYPTQTVTAEDDKEAVYKAAKLWGLGKNWNSVVDDAIPLRLGEVKA
ncbi:MAG: hypothetical protein HFF06_06350 [Oscillospiraceae bacterium]|nr:hypothetical protein [Oscillospiraceae bacterium]